MQIGDLTTTQQLVLMLAALVLFTSFAMLAQTRLPSLIRTFAWQGALLSATTALMGYVNGHPDLYLSALLTLLLKVLLIPWLLSRLLVRLDMVREVEGATNPAVLLLGGTGLVVFSYYISLPIEQLSASITRNTIAVTIAVVLLGLLLMIARKKAVTQVVGFMSMENGVFFAAVASAQGMPLVVELGVAFDVLVAAILFGVFFFQIRASFDSLDVDRMSRLSEQDP